MRKLILLIIILSSNKLHAQKNYNIQFVHVGGELKTTKALIISIEKQILPYGFKRPWIGVYTDKATFAAVRKFITSCTFLHKDTTNSINWIDYKIFQPGDFTLYLGNSEQALFFTKLTQSLKDNCFDQHVVDALSRYIHQN